MTQAPRRSAGAFLRGIVVALFAITPAPAYATQEALSSSIALVLTALLAAVVVAILLALALGDDVTARKRDRKPGVR